MRAAHFDVCLNPTWVTNQPDRDFRCCVDELLRVTFWAVGVLQTEASFMAFSHLGAIQRQQIVVGEHLNAVVVPEERQQQQQQQHRLSVWCPYSGAEPRTVFPKG